MLPADSEAAPEPPLTSGPDHSPPLPLQRYTPQPCSTPPIHPILLGCQVFTTAMYTIDISIRVIRVFTHPSLHLNVGLWQALLSKETYNKYLCQKKVKQYMSVGRLQ